MAKVLVTGATGFTGGKLAERLTCDGHDVIAFVRHSSNTARLRDLGIDCRIVDIRNADAVDQNFDGVTKVFHIAAAYRSEHSDHGQFRAVNVDGTENLLSTAARAGVERFVHCSTVGVQGEIKVPPATEDYRFKPGDQYQQSKLDGELLALKYHREGLLPVAVVRPVGIYGPGDTRFLKLFRAIQRGHFVMIGSGKALYHMTYIDDLIDGLLLAGERAEALGEVFTIAGPEYTTLRELTNSIAKELDRRPPFLRIPYKPVYWAAVLCDRFCRAINVDPPLYPRRVEFFELDRAFSTEKARQLLGYRPGIELREGLARTAAAYREDGLL